MRMLVSFALGCALMIGINLGASSNDAAANASPAELSAPVDDSNADVGAAYECKYSPYCQRAAQCIDYCAGGAPVCFQGCCSCAS